MRSSSIFSGQKSDAQKYFKKDIDTRGFSEKTSSSQNEWIQFNFVGCKLRRHNPAPRQKLYPHAACEWAFSQSLPPQQGESPFTANSKRRTRRRQRPEQAQNQDR